MNLDTRRKLTRDLPLYQTLSENLLYVQALYQQSYDARFRPFLSGGQLKAALIYIDGLTDTEQVEEYVMDVLMSQDKPVTNLQQALKETLPVLDAKEIFTIADCITSVSSGYPILFLQGEKNALSLALSKMETRSIEEPEAESLIRGPREGFIEKIEINTSLIRRRIASPHLKMEQLTIGTYTKTKVILSYIEGKAQPELVKRMRHKLNQIKLDGVLDSGYLEGAIKDDPYSPFPQFMTSERPDVASANLLEGRIVVLVDGTPFTLIAPVSFSSFIQAPEDYYYGFIIASAVRLLRYFFIFLSITLPSLYVAILAFHQEMIPTTLVTTIATSREAVPFPAFIEALMMEVTFEALREAGLRLPKQIGPAVSIVGGLVIGQSAVQAGIVSAPMVIIVALTGIASFIVPRYSQGIALRLLRFPIIFLAGLMGLFGLTIGLILVVTHLCRLTSLGVPYLRTNRKGSWKDTLIRAPWKLLNKRGYTAGQSQKGN